MNTIIVLNNPSEWKFDFPGVSVVAAWDYLTDSAYTSLKNVRLYNLCRSYRYQSYGYYVSLLAAARRHKPIPSVTTINDMKSPSVIRIMSDDLEDLIQRKLKHIQSRSFMLSIYFGRNVAKHYDSLCSRLYRLFEAPFLRAYFVHNSGKWQLSNISPVSLSEVPEDHYDFIREAAQAFFSGKRFSAPKRPDTRYDLAILFNPDDPSSPSDPKAVEQFEKAAEKIGFGTEIINKDDYGRLAEFDALFIRETTNVNHHTYRFARRAEAEGLVVIDDPLSILLCTNKVYLNELLTHQHIPVPPTLVVNKGNVKHVPNMLNYPIILKQPDGAFSQGVEKVENETEYAAAVERFFEKSMLFIAQAFMPTAFDWRVGVFDQKPLFVCKYFMASRHWQIVKRDKNSGRLIEGRFETMAVDQAPEKVVKLALKASRLIGDGLYGIDIKQDGDKLFVIEINDNQSIDNGVEDAVIKKELYETIMQGFMNRIEKRKLQDRG